MAETVIKIACSACKRVTYWRPLSRRKKGLERKKIETSKYCKFCRKHTLHKETK